jgi:RNA polymerase sigma factor (sigma-70 family)
VRVGNDPETDPCFRARMAAHDVVDGVDAADGDGGDTGCGDGEQIADLLLRARTGDQRAVGEIVERCTPMLRALARRYVARASEVDDVVQDVWVTFVQNLHRIHEPVATRAWLVQVVTHTAWRAQSKAARAVPTADIGDSATPDDTEDIALRRVWCEELRARVTPALRVLRPADRRLVVLLAQDRPPDYRTVSRLLNRPVGSIGPTRQRALARLRREPSLAADGRLTA